MLIRRAWVGEPPRERVDDQVDVYRSYSSKSRDGALGQRRARRRPDGRDVVDGLARRARHAPAPTRSTSASTSPGCTPDGAREQIAGLGDEVLPPAARRQRSTGSGDRDDAASTASRTPSGTCRPRPAPTRRRPRPPDALGAARRFLAQGDGGFYTQVVRMPPGFEAPVHSHDHSEVFMVLEGSCTFDGEPMARFDLDGRRGRTSPTASPPVPTACRSSSCARARPRYSPTQERVVSTTTTSSSAAATSSTAPGCRAGASTSACATAASPRSARLDGDDATEEIDADGSHRRARHRRRAHALRPADHVRSVRDDVVLPRRHHRRRRQLRVLGRAVQARGPRLPRRHLRPGREHGPDRDERDHVGRVRDVPRVPRRRDRAGSASTSRATSATRTFGAG